MSPVVTFENLTLGYDQYPAVQHLETEIANGSLTAIVGPNGAGKSTLLKGVTGTLAPLSGHISFNLLNDKDIAYLPQQAAIDRSFPLCVIDLVAMGLWHETGSFGRFGRQQYKRIADAIAAVGLEGLEKRPIHSLSGGQMQRVLFARLLLQDAQLILLDEPFTAIDARSMADLIEIIHHWHGEGRTIIAVLHDMDIVRSHFPQTLMLARELIGHGPTEHILTDANQIRARQMCEACDGPPHVCGRSAA